MVFCPQLLRKCRNRETGVEQSGFSRGNLMVGMADITQASIEVAYDTEQTETNQFGVPG